MKYKTFVAATTEAEALVIVRNCGGRTKIQAVVLAKKLSRVLTQQHHPYEIRMEAVRVK